MGRLILYKISPRVSLGRDDNIILPLYLKDDQNSSKPDKDTSDDCLYCEMLVEEYRCKDKCQHYTHLVDGHDFGNLSHLEGLVITEPGCAGGKPGKDEENPAFGTD